MIKIKKTKFNIFILGDTQVGKTSLLEVFRENTFNLDEFPTIGIDIFKEKISIEEFEYKLKIFDTSGKEKYKNIIIPKLHLADGFIFVFSVDNKESLKQIDILMHIIDEVVKLKKIKILVGNKIDIKDREIKNEEGVKFAKEKNLKYFEASAKTGFSVKELFNQIIYELYKSNKQYELINNIKD